MKRPLSLALYGLAAATLEPLVPALLKRRVGRGKEDPARLPERLGRASLPRPAGRLAWLHGASVGESLSLLPLIDRLRALAPDLSLLVTSGTVTSAELMARRLPEGVIHQYAPVDGTRAVGRFLDHWRPDLGVFVESELWPNLLLSARARGTRLALVSARVTEGSAAGWRRAPAAARAVVGAFDLILAQDQATADRIAALGGRDDGRLNLKLAGEPPPIDPAALALAEAQAAGRPVLVAASTHAGEDEAVLRAFAPLAGEALLALVPRHPVRASDILALATSLGLAANRRTANAFGETPVHIADTLGELGLWFRLGRGAFIGGSLVEGPGGHNPLEATRLGKPVATGPHIDNWRGVYEPLIARGEALVVADAAALTAAFRRFLAGEPRIDTAGDAALAELDVAARRLLELAR